MKYLILEQQGTLWEWTLYSAYHRPLAASPQGAPSREACLRSAEEATKGSVPVRVIDRLRGQPSGHASDAHVTACSPRGSE